MYCVKKRFVILATSALLGLAAPAFAQTKEAPSLQAQTNWGFRADMTVAEVAETMKGLAREASKSEYGIEIFQSIPEAALKAIPVNIVAQAMVELSLSKDFPTITNVYDNVSTITSALVRAAGNVKGPDGTFLANKPADLAASIAKGLKEAGLADKDIATGMFVSATSSGIHAENEKAISAGLVQAGMKPKDIVDGYFSSGPLTAQDRFNTVRDLGLPLLDVLDELTITGENPELKNTLLRSDQIALGGNGENGPALRSAARLSPENLALLGDMTVLEGRSSEQLGLVARAMMGQPGMTPEKVAQAMNAGGLPFATIAAALTYGGTSPIVTLDTLSRLRVPAQEIINGIVASGYEGAAFDLMQGHVFASVDSASMTSVIKMMTGAGLSPESVNGLLERHYEFRGVPTVEDRGEQISIIDMAFNELNISKFQNTPLPGTGRYEQLNPKNIFYGEMRPEQLAQVVENLKAQGGEYTLANIAGMLREAGVPFAQISQSLILAKVPPATVATTLSSFGLGKQEILANVIGGLAVAKMDLGDVVTSLRSMDIATDTIVSSILHSGFAFKFNQGADTLFPSNLAQALKDAGFDAKATVQALAKNNVDVAAIVVNASPGDPAAQALASFLQSSQAPTSAPPAPALRRTAQNTPISIPQTNAAAEGQALEQFRANNAPRQASPN